MSRLNRLLDFAGYAACRTGLSHFPRWDEALASPQVNLYADKLSRGLPQFATHWGITPFYASSRNIFHDVRVADRPRSRPLSIVVDAWKAQAPGPV